MLDGGAMVAAPRALSPPCCSSATTSSRRSSPASASRGAYRSPTWTASTATTRRAASTGKPSSHLGIRAAA